MGPVLRLRRKIRLYRTPEPDGETLTNSLQKFLEIQLNTWIMWGIYGDNIKTNNKNLGAIRKCRYSCCHSKKFTVLLYRQPSPTAQVRYITNEYAGPTKVPNTSVIYPTTGDGPATAINIFGGSVLVHYKNNSIWKWAGIDPEEEATWTEIPAGVRCGIGQDRKPYPEQS